MSAPNSQTGSDPFDNLVETFRALLDEALVSAIASDYDLTEPTQYEAAKQVLQGLAADVDAEDATGFNPSGTSNNHDESSSHLDDRSLDRSHSQDTSSTASDSAATASSAPTDPGYAMPRLTRFNGNSEEDKVLQLQSMFSELKPHDINFALKKANGDFQVALDELLNIQYLDSTGQRAKGVEGFFAEDEANGNNKGKRRKKKGKKGSANGSPGTPTEGQGSAATDTMKQQEEIAYLADRMDLPYTEVAELYRREWCSIGATAVEFLERYLELGIITRDEEGRARVKDVASKYPNVPEKYLPTLIQLTAAIPEFSYDIAQLLERHYNREPDQQRLDFSYQLKPITGEEIEGSNRSIQTKTKKTTNIADSPGMSGPADYSEALQLSNDHHRARLNASQSAALMHRRGASSPLYRQAAGYYAEQARDQARFAQQATSAAARLLVDQQSSSTKVDLHGVLVKDGVKIAREKAQNWWHNLGEFRVKKAREQPLTIITGLGRHSSGGVSQLRQAVAAALLQDGWKMQVETGRFVITGRR